VSAATDLSPTAVGFRGLVLTRPRRAAPRRAVLRALTKRGPEKLPDNRARPIRLRWVNAFDAPAITAFGWFASGWFRALVRLWFLFLLTSCSEGSGAGSSAPSEASSGLPIPSVAPLPSPSAVPSATASPPAPEFVPLFDGQTLNGWSVNRSDGDGLPAEQIFTVDADGIHVYAGAEQGSVQPPATLTTTREYSRYVLEFEYKWGTNRFGERAETERDAGVLYHVHTNVSAVWPPSLEMQMGTSELGGRWVTGDAFILGGFTRAVINGQVATEGRFTTSVLAERPHGEWNQLRLRVDGADSARYELNGLELNQLGSFEKWEVERYVPLDRGAIALQAEYAELWYRNVRIQEL